MSNSQRDYLLTSFSCSECGDTLKVALEGNVKIGKRIPGYDGKKSSSMNVGQLPLTSKHPQSHQAERMVVFIEPCRLCLKPAKEVVSAVSVLMKAASDE